MYVYVFDSFSEHANDIVLVVVHVFPSGRAAEVWIVKELSPTLCPPDRLSLGVLVDHGRVYS